MTDVNDFETVNIMNLHTKRLIGGFYVTLFGEGERIVERNKMA